jgi:hypothetical protein
MLTAQPTAFTAYVNNVQVYTTLGAGLGLDSGAATILGSSSGYWAGLFSCRIVFNYVLNSTQSAIVQAALAGRFL